MSKKSPRRKTGILYPENGYKSYGYVVSLGRDAITGKPKQKRVRGFATEADAVAARSKVVVDRHQGTYFEPSEQPLAEYLLAEWLPSRRDLKPSTWEAYRINFECHVQPRIGSIPLARLTTARLNEFYGELLENGRRRGPRPDGSSGLSEQTVRNIHAALRKALKDAATQGKILRNPAEYATPPRPDRPEMKVWTASELFRFLPLAAEDRLYPLYLVLATTGMRRGEVLGLRWGDVLDDGSIQIRRARVAISYGDVREGPLKSRKGKRRDRNVPLDPRTLAALRSYRTRQAEERLAWGPAYKDSGYIFTTENGEPIHPESLSRGFQRLVRSINATLPPEDRLPVLHLHELRHTWATLALQAGAHPSVAQRILGHSTIAITMDTYTHAIPALGREAVNVVADIAHGTRADAGGV